MVGFHRAIFGSYRGTFNQRQQVALDAFTTDRSAAHVRHGNLVDFVEKDDAIGFRVGQSCAVDIVLVQALFGLFLDELGPRVGDLHFAAFQIVFAKGFAHHFAKVDHADIAAHAGNFHRRGRAVRHFNLDFDIVHVAITNALAKCFARGFARGITRQRLQNSFHRCGFGGLTHMFAAAFFLKTDGLFSEVTGDLLNVATDIANFGELGRFDLDKRCIRKLSETARYLGLAATRRANHQDVFWRHLIAQIRAETLAAPAIAQRHSDRTFRVGLSNNMFVESSHNGFRCQSVFHYCLDGKLLLPFK